MNFPQTGNRSSLSPTASLIDTQFLRQTAEEGVPLRVTRLHGSAAQLWVAAVLAVGALSFFTIAFA